VSSTGAYTSPPSNPFAKGGGKPEIFALGLRNPWRWSFDRDTGDLWLGDVGQGQREEIDRIERGGNYGWKYQEGNNCYGGDCRGPYLEPVTDYPRSTGNCVVGGYVYRGSAIPSLVGTYLYADYSGSVIFALRYDEKTGAPITPPKAFVRTPSWISSFGEGADGEIYVTQYTAGTVLKLVPGPTDAGATQEVSLPQKLSSTGCVNADDPTKLAAGVIPFDVNVPYWADGVEFSRAFAVPDGAKIKVLADGRFEFPTGSVLMQTASRNGRRLYTRFLARHDDGDFSGYAYAWNDEQTDATIIHGAGVVRDGSFSAYVTHPAECLSCHTTNDRVLGFVSRQLNRDYTYPNGARLNQLTQFELIGLFDSSLPAVAKAEAYPAIKGTASVDSRARTYLAVNCATCHLATAGTDAGVPGLRPVTSLTDVSLCNASPERGRLSVPAATILTPGSPEFSVLSLRMHADDWSHMPHLESRLVDETGSALIDDWIKAGAGCPVPRTDGGG
jgi:uncharacterized repeat protein (TIGR03806 family)